MQHYLLTRIIRIAFIVSAGLGLSSCVAYAPPPGRGHVYTPPPASVAYYSYWYYPDIQVYFDFNRQVYFYFSNNHWVQAHVLPPSLRARLGGYVTIQSRYNQPYIEYHDHRRKYPPHYREVYRPPQQHNEYSTPPGHSVPAPRDRYKTPYKQPPTSVTSEPHAKSPAADKDKTRDKDKKTKQSKDAKKKPDKDKQSDDAKHKDDKGDPDKDRRDSHN